MRRVGRVVEPVVQHPVRKVEIHGVKAPAADTWVLVTGEWRPTGEPGSPDADPAFDADSIEKAAEPMDPYEDDAPDLSAS
ncbi:hypothetical protein [Streptomyces phaeofaciens]|uniref:hypothetical protein n=1 Tax=Streptomyces phaeofaciens TaxID=68254 RepID=UPI00369C64EA